VSSSNKPIEICYSAAEIYEEHSEFIRNAIVFHIKDERQVDDIFQDFFIHLTTYPPSEEIRNMRGFLYRSITNFILCRHRRQKDYQNCLQNYAKNNLIRSRYDSEKRVIDAEEAQKMYALIEELLPPRESAAIIERYKNDNDIHEVAETLGLDVKSVSRYISHGLSKIRKLLLVGNGE
jgi:RNA polymerase sigma factor (sigma-70 family)